MVSLGRICSFVILTLSLIMPWAQLPLRTAGMTWAATTAALTGQKCFLVSPGTAATLTNASATLEIGADAVTATTPICITPLDQTTMAPMDHGLTDVTLGQRRGYRFTPHGMRFNTKIKVRLPYAPALIPPGTTEQELKTYYFDDQLGRWQELERVAVDTTAKMIVSLTDHFTDMINGTITVPDHPEALSYNPTSIKDIKAADPGAGISLIAPPQANAMGDARLSYPIEVPSGRNGMQPQLMVTYTSSGGNGWLGMGWDLTIPTITVDTRWGVPRYDGGQETETYLLNGEQLTPLANRGQLQPRSANKEFHTRAEGQFRRIIRRGEGPDHYWWEVTDKNGTTFFYGGDPATQAIDSEAVLADPNQGNVFRWMLREVRDANGNTIRYHYDLVNGGGGPDDEPWRQIYPRSIRYTGRVGGSEGFYEVLFNRESIRQDVMIDGRAGFMTVLGDLLTSIDVRFDSQVIRSYQLDYRQGEFAKSLLSAIALRGLDGSQELSRHTFDYFAMERSGDALAAFEPVKLFNTPPDTLPAKNGLSRSEDSVTGGGGSIGVGIGPLSLTGGGGGFGGDEETKRTFVDSAGKGLPGFVDESGSALVSTLVPSESSASARFEPVSLSGVPDNGLGHADRSGWNVEGSLKIGGFTGGANYTRNAVEDDHIMVDMDGDGFVDLVSQENGCLKVQLNDAGTGFHPYQNPDTGSDCWGNLDFSGLPSSHPDRMVTAKQSSFLVDPLMRWTAPIDGAVTIAGPIQKLATGGDGVIVEIFHDSARVWRRTFTGNDLSPCTPSGTDGCNGSPLSVSLAVGDQLYFKIGSIDDTASDDVSWSPTVTYQVASTLLPLREPYGPFIYTFSQQQDHRLAGRPSVQWVASAEGTVRVRGLLNKQTTSDDVTFEVEKLPMLPSGGGGVIFSHTQPAGSTTQGAVPFDVPQDIPVVRGDRLIFRARSDAPFDPERAQWEPQVEYTSYCRPEPGASPICGPVVRTTLPTGQVIYQIQGDPDPDLTLPAAAVVQRAQVRYPVFRWRSPEAAPQEATRVLRAPRTGSLQITGTFTGDEPATVLVQGVHQLFYKQTFPASRLPRPIRLTLDAVQDQELFFTVLSPTDTHATLRLAVDGEDQSDVVNYRHPDPATLFDDDSDTIPSDPMSGGYHSWSFGDWKDSTPFDPDQIVFPMTSPVDPRPNPYHAFGLAVPIPQGLTTVPLPLWAGRGFDSYIAAGQMKPSRFSALGRGPNELRTASTWNLRVSAGVEYGGVGLGGNVSIGDSSTELDFIDFNGDRYPDSLSAGVVRFNDGRGGFRDQEIPGLGIDGALRETVNRNIGANAGGGKSFNLADSKSKTSTILSTDVNVGLDYGLSSTHNDLIDINGDGLPDQVRTDGNRVLVRLNLGYRLGREIEWPRGATWATDWIADGVAGDVIEAAFKDEVKPNVSLRLQDTGSNNVGFGGKFDIGFVSVGAGAGWTFSIARGYTDLIDVNGDGLPDQVMRLPGAGTLRVKLNLGDHFDDERPWRVPTEWGVPVDDGNFTFFSTEDALSFRRSQNFTVSGSAGFCFGICVGGSAYHSSGSSSAHMGLYDADGDGNVDFVLKKDGEANLRVKLNRIGKTNLLKTIQRPLGAVIDLDYARSGDTTEQPGNRWVLSRTRVFDGVAGDGIDHQVITYTYTGGRYDRAEREFYGFATVTEEQRDPANSDALYRSIVHEFHTDSFYTKGLLTRSVTQDAAGQRFRETVHSYRLVDIQTGSDANPQSLDATVFPQLVRTDQHFYEGSTTPGKSTYTAFQYDALGNVTQFVDGGDSGTADDVTATIAYSMCADTHIVGMPTKIVVTANGAELRHREATIDCVTGNLTQVSEYLSATSAAVTDLAYFPSGMLQTVVGPSNSNSPAQRFTLTYTYDSVVETYITGIVDSFGYTSTATYNLKFGQPESTTDINGNTTSYTYDSFGRTTSITGPYEQGFGRPTITFDYRPDAQVPSALTHHLDRFRDLNDPIDTVLFTDGLKRVIQTKKDATIFSGPAAAAQDKLIVSGRTTFDAFGRTVEQFYPVTETKTAAEVFNPTPDTSAPATRMAYDVLDRTTKTTIPDGTFTTLAYGFGADRSGATQFLTTVIDANGKQKRTYRDVRDLITGVQEFNTRQNGTTQVIWTSYRYDPLDQLVAVNDDQHNVTTITYDNLGRRTSIDNPDTGKTEMVYDLASNLIAKITANLRPQGKRITYRYDFNRLTAMAYPNFPGNNVTYTYGAPGAADNRAGRITLVTDESGKEERFYGELGEITKEIKTVATDTGAAPGVYTTQYTFDTFGRLQQLTYPDGEVLTYRYDSGGLVNKVTGTKAGTQYTYVKRLEYDRFEQRAFLEEGNNVRTQYTYRPDNRRLQNLQAGQPGMPAFQNLDYSYDKVGNVLNLKNEVAVPPASQFGGPTNQTFQYDDLYRLTSASGTYQFMPNKTREYSLSLAYDTIHNLVSKQQTDQIVQPSGRPIPQQKTTYSWAYRYDSSHPHAPTHIGDRTFTYDANGNQAGWTHDRNGTRRTIVWDEENRIQSIFDNGHEKSYKYNDEGERVLKRGPQGETAYVNQYFSIRNRTIGTKHVFVGTTRLVSKLMKSGGVYEKDQYFFHADHLGSTNYVTDAKGTLFEHLEYFPFGETWVEESSNTQRTPYLFTGKELDEETDLYYYGARYYDPRTSVWQSADPNLEKYVASDIDDAFNEGVFNSRNLGLFTYGYNNPLTFRDPDGRFAIQAAGAAVGFIAGLGFQAALDIYHGKVSSFSEYAGAAVGGAAGGVAATVCGPACAGASAAAASNVTQQAVNAFTDNDKNVTLTDRAKSLVVDTAIGAVGGQVAGKVLPAVLKPLSNKVKGAIGEGLTEVGLRLTGQGVARRQVSNNVGRSTFDFLTKTGKFVESKFGTSKLSGPQRAAARRLAAAGNPLELHQWSYPTVSGVGAAGPGSAAASAPTESR